MYNFFLFITFFVLFLSSPFRNFSKDYIEISLGDDFKLTAEVADTSFKRAKGLMFRKPLKKDYSMLFVFPNDKRPSFYNKNVSFDVLVLWIDKNNKVTGFSVLKRNSYELKKSEVPIKFALELNAKHYPNPEIFVGKTLKFL